MKGLPSKTPLLWLFALFGGLVGPGFDGLHGQVTAVFENGERRNAEEVQAWQDENDHPAIDGVLLFDPSNPVRWIRRSSAARAMAWAPFVEFIGGDRLPGRAIHFQGRSATGRLGEDSRLIVEPSVTFTAARHSRPRQIAVRPAFVQRIVWSETGDVAYRPRTIFLPDGGHVAFRSLRIQGAGVKALTEQGVRSFSLSELAGIHFPRVDAWENYLDQLLFLAPNGRGRIQHIRTTDGLRVTTSASRFRPMFVGNRNDPRRWYHVVQPAWSRAPLYLRYDVIVERWFFAPQEVPLSRIAPTGVKQNSPTGAGWTWQRDVNTQGAPLRSGGREFAWGLGVHASTELTFQLPPLPGAFRAGIGLDSMVGAGGCARARVHFASASAARREVFVSPLMVGSAQVTDTGAIPLPKSSAGETSLILDVDMAHEERPPRADPLDIRDVVDWLEPTIVLEEHRLRQEVRRRAYRWFATRHGWELNDMDVSTGEFAVVWIGDNQRDSGFRLAIRPYPPFLRLRRRLEPMSLTRLVLRVHKVGNVETRVDVRVNGESVGNFLVGSSAGARHNVSLSKFREQPITLEVTHLADGGGWLVWNGVVLEEEEA